MVHVVASPRLVKKEDLHKRCGVNRLPLMRGEEPAHRQRIRIGLTGLAVVFLLVLIGAALTRWSAGPDSANMIAANAELEPNEPLAEIGAAPGESSAAGDNQQTNQQ